MTGENGRQGGRRGGGGGRSRGGREEEVEEGGGEEEPQQQVLWSLLLVMVHSPFSIPSGAIISNDSLLIMLVICGRWPNGLPNVSITGMMSREILVPRIT